MGIAKKKRGNFKLFPFLALSQEPNKAKQKKTNRRYSTCFSQDPNSPKGVYLFTSPVFKIGHPSKGYENWRAKTAMVVEGPTGVNGGWRTHMHKWRQHVGEAERTKARALNQHTISAEPLGGERRLLVKESTGNGRRRERILGEKGFGQRDELGRMI